MDGALLSVTTAVNYSAAWHDFPDARDLCLRTTSGRMGILFASLGRACVIFTAGITLFPFVMPSSAYPLSSLTVWDSTSSQMTLSIMLVIVLIFLPIVLLYTVWSYYKMLGRINVETIRRHNHELY